MVYDVLVTQDANKRYIARVLSLSDIIVSGPDEKRLGPEGQQYVSVVAAGSTIAMLREGLSNETVFLPQLS